MNLESLRTQYSEAFFKRAERLRGSLGPQLITLANNNNITLGVPIESRVKTWSSIAEKIARNNLRIDDIMSLTDLIGFRVILLFRADLDRVEGAIRRTLNVLSMDDKSKKSDESHFGYQSTHYVV